MSTTENIAFNAAIDFAIDDLDRDVAIDFLIMWREGDWKGIKNEFPKFDLSTIGQLNIQIE